MATVKLLLLQSLLILLCFSKRLNRDVQGDLNRPLTSFTIQSEPLASRQFHIRYPQIEVQTKFGGLPSEELNEYPKKSLSRWATNAQSWSKIANRVISNKFKPSVSIPMNTGFRMQNHETTRDLKEMEAAARQKIQVLKEKLTNLKTAKFINDQNTFYNQKEIKDILVKIDPIFANGQVVDYAKSIESKKGIFKFEFINYQGLYSQIELKQNPNNHYQIEFLNFATLDLNGFLKNFANLNRIATVKPFPLRFHPQPVNKDKYVPQKNQAQDSKENEGIDESPEQGSNDKFEEDLAENKLQRETKKDYKYQKPAYSAEKMKEFKEVKEVKKVKELKEVKEMKEVKEVKEVKEKKEVDETADDDEGQFERMDMEDMQNDDYLSDSTDKPADKTEKNEAKQFQNKEVKLETQNQKTMEGKSEQNGDTEKERGVEVKQTNSVSLVDRIFMMLSNFPGIVKVVQAVQGKKEILI